MDSAGAIIRSWPDTRTSTFLTESENAFQQVDGLPVLIVVEDSAGCHIPPVTVAIYKNYIRAGRLGQTALNPGNAMGHAVLARRFARQFYRVGEAHGYSMSSRVGKAHAVRTSAQPRPPDCLAGPIGNPG